MKMERENESRETHTTHMNSRHKAISLGKMSPGSSVPGGFFHAASQLGSALERSGNFEVADRLAYDHRKCANSVSIPKTVVLLMAGLLSVPSCAFSAQKPIRAEIPPFVAEATVSIRLFQNHGPAPSHEYKFSSHFGYSNGWWEIEQEFQYPPQSAGQVTRVKNIPGGTRTYGFKRRNEDEMASDVISTATAHAVPFPDPTMRGLFVVWLGLCPYPDLPILDSTRIRRLSALSVLNDIQNIGTYKIEYLEPGSAFVSRLEIVSNGVDSTSEPRPGSQPVSLPNKYIEFIYNVTRATNYNGIAFPVEATFTMYSPDPRDHSGMDIATALDLRLEITRLQWEFEENPPGFAHRSELFAFDYRFPDLPADRAVQYIVHHDLWASTDDKTLQVLADVVRSNYRRGETPARSIHSGFVLLFTLSVLVSGIAFYRSVKKRST